MSTYCRHYKPILDRATAALGFVVLFPLLAAVSVLVLLRHGRPVMFRQVRPGLHEKPFTLFKFRTMTAKLGPDGSLLPDKERLTKLGTFLRRTSLDELPELWNVLKGDMSLVGPRPLLQEYLPFYTEEERKRFDVLPGITGWAQIRGRNALPWDERLACDAWYVEHQSLSLDMRILWLTFGKVLRREGIREDSNLAEDRRGSRQRMGADPQGDAGGESV
jgi:sugar transferase EpsL